jgi:hypothetical protein
LNWETTWQSVVSGLKADGSADTNNANDIVNMKFWTTDTASSRAWGTGTTAKTKAWFIAAADFHNDVLTWHTNASKISTGNMGAAHVTGNTDNGKSTSSHADKDKNLICDTSEAGGG